MKKYIHFLVVLTLVLTTGAGATHAQTDPTRTTTNTKITKPGMDLLKIREERRAEIRNTMEEARTKIHTLRQNAKTKWQALKDDLKNEKDTAKEKIKELRISLREKALGRFDNIAGRLTNFEDRINAAITKLEARGVDVMDAKDSMDTADSSLTDAKDKIAEIDGILSTSIDELSSEDKAKLKTLVQDTESLLRATREAMRAAVKSLKDKVKTTKEDNKNNTTQEGTNEDNNQ